MGLWDSASQGIEKLYSKVLLRTTVNLSWPLSSGLDLRVFTFVIGNSQQFAVMSLFKAHTKKTTRRQWNLNPQSINCKCKLLPTKLSWHTNERVKNGKLESWKAEYIQSQ